ncbi:uncharacterized protein TM35_001691010, partial [Trypanosoma theileri]
HSLCETGLITLLLSFFALWCPHTLLLGGNGQAYCSSDCVVMVAPLCDLASSWGSFFFYLETQISGEISFKHERQDPFFVLLNNSLGIMTAVFIVFLFVFFSC